MRALLAILKRIAFVGLSLYEAYRQWKATRQIKRRGRKDGQDSDQAT